MKHQRSCSKYLPEWLCFGEFPERRFELGTKLQTEKLAVDLQNGEYLFVLIFNFVTSSLQLAIFSLAAKIALIHFEMPEITKMLHNVYKGSCTGKYIFEETFHSRFTVLALNVHGLRHRSKPYRFPPGW
jgi:hypothetical protein